MFRNFFKYRRISMMRLVGILLIVAFLAGSLPDPVLAATPAATTACTTRYTVKSGDTLSSIALQYKINWLDLAAANSLTSPYTIYIDQVLCIPSSASTTTSSSTSSSGKAGFSVALAGRFLIIKASNYPKNSIFYVKAAKGHFQMESPIVKLGMLRTFKKVSVVAIYRLPKAWSTTKYIRVCLKNVRTDVNDCQTAVRY